MKKIFFAACLAVLCFSSAVHAEIIEIWKQGVPGENAPKEKHLIDTKTEKGVIRLTRVSNPTLKVTLPEKAPNGVAVIVCPGGAYQALAYDKEGTEVAQWLARQGFTAFTLAYRVPANPNGALQDLQRAIRVVREKYAPEKIGVIGFSAGASLSARAATRFGETLYPPQDVADKLSCRPDFAMLIYPAYLDGGPGHSLTPELKVSANTPPMFIFGTLDDYHYSSRSALVMAEAMRANRRPVDLHYLSKGGHGYGMRSGVGRVWPKLAEAWLQGFSREK